MVRFPVLFERYAPRTAALIGMVIYIFFGPQAYATALAREWDVQALYAAVFDTSSIVSAFLFSFLVFIRTTTNQFLEAFRDHPSYNILTRHFLWATATSFALTIGTIPFLVVVPKPLSLYSITFFVVLVWVGLTTYVIFAVLRSAYQFLAVLDAAYSERFVKQVG